MADDSELSEQEKLARAQREELERQKTAKEIEVKSGFSHETTFRLLKGLVEKKHLK